MTAYRNFIEDYPSRCSRLLGEFSGDAARQDLEVTLLLTVAATGLLVPYARLSEAAHPSGDRERFAEARTRLTEHLATPFLSTVHGDDIAGKSWRVERYSDVPFDPDRLELSELKPMGSRKTVGRIVKILRNALAHGNVFSRGSPITHFLFLSRVDHKNPEVGYELIVVSPTDFRRFMEAWLDMFAGLHVPGKHLAESGLYPGLPEDEFVADSSVRSTSASVDSRDARRT